MPDDVSAGQWVSEPTAPSAPPARESEGILSIVPAAPVVREPETVASIAAPPVVREPDAVAPIPPVVREPETMAGSAPPAREPEGMLSIVPQPPVAREAGPAPAVSGALATPSAPAPAERVATSPQLRRERAPVAAPPSMADDRPLPRPSPAQWVSAVPDDGVISSDDYARIASAIEQQIGHVIVGQQGLVRAVLIALLCEGHVLLEGVPGLGKTQLLKTLSQVVELDFSRVQFTPDLMPADIVGTQVLEEAADGRREFRYRPGPVFASLVLADEINRATPKTQSALLEAMQERSVTVAGETRPLPRPFLVMATQNPLEMEGTYPLPEAQLDRFLIKVLVPFPSVDELEAIVDRTTGSVDTRPERVADAPTLRRMINLTRQVPVPKHVARHAVELVAASHPKSEATSDLVRKYVRFGASPRGAQALVLTAKAAALLDGRPNASIDDVRTMARAALRHRVVLGYEATADGVDADAVVESLLDELKPPPAGMRGAP